LHGSQEINTRSATQTAGAAMRTHDTTEGNVVLYQLSYTRDTKTWLMPFYHDPHAKSPRSAGCPAYRLQQGKQQVEHQPFSRDRV
ncbi:MAG: hypothetical protein ACK6A7_13900, partial [Planctomycetota bacterium]